MKYKNAAAVLSFIFLSSINFSNTAITLQNPVAATGSTVSVFGNVITDCRIGIHAENVPNIRIGGYDGTPTAQPNTITYNLGANSLSDYYHGISLQNCEHADVLENTVTNDVPTAEGNLRGIVIENCDNANIGCNTLTNLGRAMRFEGFCLGNPGTQLIDNYMKDYEVAIEMDVAQIPTQGLPDPTDPNLGEPWDNVWDHSDPANHLKVYGSLALPGQLIKWYHQGNDDPNNVLSPNPYNPLLVIPKPNQTDAGVECANQNRIGSFDRDNILGAAVGDSAGFTDYAGELTYFYKMYVYDLLRKNDTLLSLGNANDASFQQFYTDLAETNIGLLSLVKQAIDSGLIDSAAVINETVSDTNSYEYARKTVNTILTEKVLKGLEMDDADTAALEFIFSQHWITAGKAVYEAAALLGKEYHSPSVSLRHAQPAQEQPRLPLMKTGQVKMHPNPANDKLFIEGLAGGKNVVEIYDSYLRVIYRASCSAEHVSIPLANFANGVYSVRISDQEGCYFNRKFVVIK